MNSLLSLAQFDKEKYVSPVKYYLGSLCTEMLKHMFWSISTQIVLLIFYWCQNLSPSNWTFVFQLSQEF